MLGSLITDTIPLMVFGTRTLKSWVLGPCGNQSPTIDNQNHDFCRFLFYGCIEMYMQPRKNGLVLVVEGTILEASSWVPGFHGPRPAHAAGSRGWAPGRPQI